MSDTAPTRASGQRSYTPEIWRRAADDYLGGAGAVEVCERHGIALSTFRAKAKQEGWRRSDQPDPEPPEVDAAVDDEPAGAPAELADLAWRQASRAIRRGHLLGARGWTRLTQDLRVMAKMQDEAEQMATRNAAAAAREARRQAAMQTYLDAARADGVYPAQATRSFIHAQLQRGDLPVYGQEDAPPDVVVCTPELDALEASLNEDERETALDCADEAADAQDDLDGLDWRDDGWGEEELSPSDSAPDAPPPSRPPAAPLPPLCGRGEASADSSRYVEAERDAPAQSPLPQSGGGVGEADGGGPCGPDADDSDSLDSIWSPDDPSLSPRREATAEPGPPQALTAALPADADHASPVRDGTQGEPRADAAEDDRWPPAGLPFYVGLTVQEHTRRWRDRGLVPWF